MTKGRSSAKAKRKEQAPPLPGAWPREAIGVGLLALGLLTLLSLLRLTPGLLTDVWADLLAQALGAAAWLVASMWVIAGPLLIWRGQKIEESSYPLGLGALLTLLSTAGLLHLPVPQFEALSAAEAGSGGGFLGWALSYLLRTTLSDLGATLVFAFALLGGGFLLVQPFRDDWPRLAQAWEWARQRWARAAREQPRIVSTSPAPSTEEWVDLEELEAVAEPVDRRPHRSAPTTSPEPEEAEWVEEAHPVEEEGVHPALDLLLEEVSTSSEEADVQLKARIIEETLSSFGVPAKVVTIKPGPAVTQYGVEPGYLPATGRAGEQRRVRVSQITSLAKDLELALASSPVRIEAPVPGRPVVGIEVPNTKVALVSLRGVMDSEAFERLNSPLKIALGRDVSGQPVVADLTKMPHLLTAGATGSGKSVCLSSMITGLLIQNSPARLRLLMIDPKLVELTHFNGLPHLLAPVIREVEEVIDRLRWVMREMERRYQRFAQVGARNIARYNAKAGERGDAALPYIMIVIDELADLMLAAPDEIERLICRLAQMSRATGIHLVIATQRPSVDVVTGLIKANFPARISFAVPSQIDSRVILDSPGAETLLGRGDMLFMAPDSSFLLRLQGCYVSEREIARVVAFWQRRVGPRAPVAPEMEALWRGLEEREEEEDDLLEQALGLLRQHNYASTSFLQRRLRIGYPRAARLMDQLEAQGYVGPTEGSGKTRKVLLKDRPLSPEPPALP